MDDDLDPVPGLTSSKRSESNSRNVNTGGESWRSSSEQSNWPPARSSDDWRNRDSGQTRERYPWLAKSRRGGSATSTRGGFRTENSFQQRHYADKQPQNRVLEYGRNQSRGQRRVYSNNNRRHFDNKDRNCKKNMDDQQLEEIVQNDSEDVLAMLVESKVKFIEFIQSPIERCDVFVLVVQCLAKVCQSSFNELKLSLLVDTCNSNFIVSLKSYLLELPYVQEKELNDMYWKDQDLFWNNLIAFIECVVFTSPTVAQNKCRSLVDATSIACLDGLKEKHSYELPEEYSTKLKKLRERMASFENAKESCQRSRKILTPEDGRPPENFRELSVVPTREDLMLRRAFLRPNIVDGAYKDVEHYLDVQFRLLREDCFGPLRDGLSQYMADPKQRKYDHIRVYQNVKFIKPYVSHTKIGSLVQLDIKNNQKFKRMDWKNNKNLIYGSLVLFTKDNCNSFMVGTILDREEKCLFHGLIPVSIMDTELNESLYTEGDSYTMIESEVYYEPYYHVLRALQDPSFPRHIAMKQYIVDVNPEPKHPSYLKPDSEFDLNRNRLVLLNRVKCLKCAIKSESDDEIDDRYEVYRTIEPRKEAISIKKFIVLQDETWPNKDELQFNESQLEAYKLALTHEFAVIQGPPGTGKTYLGLKVANALFQNVDNGMNGCLMLVICYTNHALDQFLEGLLEVTDSIARIGGQSRNEAMVPINLTNLRRHTCSIHNHAREVYNQQKTILQSTVSEFQTSLIKLDILMNGVMKISLLNDIPEIALLRRFYCYLPSKVDALLQWLFENVKDYNVDVDKILLMNEDAATNSALADYEKENRNRTNILLDDWEYNELEQNRHRSLISCFSLEDINTKLKELIAKLKICSDPLMKRFIRWNIQRHNSFKELFNDMSQHRLRRIDVDITGDTDFNSFAPIDRWTLYFMWIQNRVLATKHEIGDLQAAVDDERRAYDDARMLLDLQVLRNRQIVGMTTTGAARMRKLLQALAPRIVIVEEAAEVLEQHVITSLTKNCQHLILIGDHQQLRPSASHILLARHYGLEVSLFERMISNGIHSRRLSVQHRMRPEIAALISPHIYTDLQNHSSVYEFPDVRGMVKNVYFFTHNHKEDSVIEGTSRRNQKEADLVLALANYLMQQGYTPDDVTILSAYKGQMAYMIKESCRYARLKGVKITVVDNYQGEESKIILLSLVRNNEENQIGFLGTANRICVALSRAKQGLYIFGNIETLKANSELWRNIATTLESGQSIGTGIPLQCQNHPKTLVTVSKNKDFEHVPEGGCKERCDFLLSECGHRCLLYCHGYDQEHKSHETECTRRCERILCELNHVCPKTCAIKCGPCERLMKKTLPCGHDKDVHCYLKPDDPRVRCLTLVEVTLPDCGHKARKPCHSDVKYVSCKVKCEKRVEKCGHNCSLYCHVGKDADHKEYRCEQSCAKLKKGCTAGLENDLGDHQCDKKCYEACSDCDVLVTKRRSSCAHTELVSCITNIDEKRCMKKCNRKLSCDHFCNKKCHETCGECTIMTMKEIPDCKHNIRVMCKQNPTNELCLNKCERTMSCGHLCKGICGEKCDPSKCTEPSSRKVDSPCGHQVSPPCNIAALPDEDLVLAKLVAACAAPCGAELACGHACRGTCARCCAGRLHVACAQPCRQINVCGHKCEELCNQICPPCKKQCEVRCQHSRCNKTCGAPCTPCQELCGRRCVHGACQRRCGDPCDRPACSEQCPRRLDCGHACRGLCGEPCPPVCNQCDPDNFPKDKHGDPFDDEAKFILLQDCGHVMEVQNMDTLMLSDRDNVKIRTCPFCSKRIINMGRYKDSINNTFREEVNPLGRKLFGDKAEILTQKKDLIRNIAGFREKHLDVLKANANIKAVFLSLQMVAKTTKTVSMLQLDMNILNMIAECYKTYLNEKLTELKEEMEAQIKMLCQVFVVKLNPRVMLEVSKQQQKDMGFEIKRMNSIIQLSKLTGHSTYITSKNLPEIQKLYNAAKASVFSWAVFDERKALESLENLQNSLKAPNVVLVKDEFNLPTQPLNVHHLKEPSGNTKALQRHQSIRLLMDSFQQKESHGVSRELTKRSQSI